MSNRKEIDKFLKIYTPLTIKTLSPNETASNFILIESSFFWLSKMALFVTLGQKLMERQAFLWNTNIAFLWKKSRGRGREHPCLVSQFILHSM